MNLVGLRFEDEYWEVGVPILDTVGKCRFADRGEEKREGVGEDICIARTDEGVRNGGRLRTLLGVLRFDSSCGGAYELPLGMREIASLSELELAASSPNVGEVSAFWGKFSSSSWIELRLLRALCPELRLKTSSEISPSW